MEYPDTRGCGLGCFYSVCPLPEAPTALPLCNAGVLEHIVHGAVAHALERLVCAAADVESGNEIVQMDERVIARRRLVLKHITRRSADLPRGERDVEIVSGLSKPRSLSPTVRRKKIQSFSQATCAAEKIPLGLQTFL